MGDFLNPEAWIICAAKAEKSLKSCKLSDRFQFERCGYFAPDYACFEGDKKLVFNRVVGLAEFSGKKKVEGNTGASRKAEQAAAAAEKERLSKIPPAQFFKETRGSEFSKYDEKGLPTHDKDGEELKKSAIKKLQKDLEKHEKLYKSANS